MYEGFGEFRGGGIFKLLRQFDQVLEEQVKEANPNFFAEFESWEQQQELMQQPHFDKLASPSWWKQYLHYVNEESEGLGPDLKEVCAAFQKKFKEED
eukprot:9585260-Lingulodinium_polyedra.AAC.1